VLGRSYKPNVGDWRETSGLALVDGLLRLGARVTAVDPHVEELVLPRGLRLADLPDEAMLGDADLVVMATNHDRFNYEIVAAASGRVLDTRHRLSTAAPGVHRL
jgi:UDP-N-acetyl-D-glucosamine dehydrogenase